MESKLAQIPSFPQVTSVAELQTWLDEVTDEDLERLYSDASWSEQERQHAAELMERVTAEAEMELRDIRTAQKAAVGPGDEVQAAMMR
jgi:DNA-binding ferritin-like protein